VLSIRAAAALLAAADSPPAIAELLAALGLTGVLRRLDAPRRSAIGLDGWLRDAQIVAGPGSVRALVARVDDGPPLREQLPKVAARLQSRAPHVRWLAAAADARDGTVALAAWNDDRRPPRVRSLVVDRARVIDSDAETLCALSAADRGDDLLFHLRWIEVLGRDALSRRFYEELELRVAGIADAASGRAPIEDRRALALLHTSRLLFLAFLEAKGWLDGRRAFLAELFDARMAGGGAFHERALRPLFFGTLNTPRARRAAAARAFGRIPFLNGGLFAPTALERRHRKVHFDDEAFGALIGGLFASYRFTAREEAATWTDAAIDPEMLGRAFESLMASHDRHTSGAFFTPQPLVAHVTDIALSEMLDGLGVAGPDVAALLADGVAPSCDAADLRRRLGSCTVLDPACGSGAFLVYALQRLSELHARLGDPRPVSEIRRDVLTRSVFGVDRNPMAAWLCELRLWLSVVIDCEVDDPMAVAPLPNLDRNIRVGDSLSGAGFVAGAATTRLERFGTLRRRYARASGARKATLGRALEREERSRALALLGRAIDGAQHARREQLLAGRAPDLFGARRGISSADRASLAALRARVSALRRERRRLADGGALPFSFAVHFADVAARGGFDAVVGNPPWVRIHRIPLAERAALRHGYFAYRHAHWGPGAEAAHAGPGFAGQVDLSALFVERGLALLRAGGVLALLVPAKLWCSLAGGGVRRLLVERATLLRVEDRTDAPASFDAAVYPSVVAARANPPGGAPAAPVTMAVQRTSALVGWSDSPDAFALDDSPGSPWLLLPPQVRRAFDALSEVGTPMARSGVGRPMLGVKCGCNDAFLVELMERRGSVAFIRAAGGRTGEIEFAVLRTALRGETVLAWGARTGTERLIWPYDEQGRPLDPLPPRAARWLARYKRRLLARADSRSARQWWSLFRIEGAAAGTARVVWADFGRRPRALVLPAHDATVPLNTCYVARCDDLDDARTLAAVLNSAVAAAWLNAVAEPARGGFRRYLGWTMARLPLPADWTRARRILAPLVEDMEARGTLASLSPTVLTEAVLSAYGLHSRQLAPLFAWSAP
jgi:hypothetical protein